MTTEQKQKSGICYFDLCTRSAYHRRILWVSNGPTFQDVERKAVMVCGDCARQYDQGYPDCDKFY